jgi:glycine/D-amino acid oxidase-like deaminating enzyme
MRPVYARSPWVDQFPKSRVPSYAKHRGTIQSDVAIIGGGLTGCATAYACAAAGLSVALFEAERVGRGGSGASTGWITDEPPVAFGDLEDAVGRRVARQAFQAWRRAALDCAALVRRLDLKCHLEPKESLTIARTPGDQQELSRDRKRRMDAGLDAPLVAARAATAAAGFAATGALRSRDSATLDPHRAALGLAAAAVARGARIFERSPVTRSAFGRDEATLTLASGLVRARWVIVATGLPTPLFKPLARHFTVGTRYAVLTAPVPAPVRQHLGARDRLLRDLADPPHRIAWVGGDRLLVSGADGDVVPARLRDRTLVQRTAQLMYELSTLYPDISGLAPAYGWDTPVAATPHGLPVLGPHRNYPHHLFAFSGGDDGVTAAYLASRILLRYCRGEAEPADAAFGFMR